MVNHFKSITVVIFFAFVCISSHAEEIKKKTFDIKALQQTSNQALDENDKIAKRIKTLKAQSALDKTDKSFLTFEIDGYSYPAVILPNDRLAPAIVRGQNRIPACIDDQYKLHPGEFDKDSGRVLCSMKVAKLLMSEEINQYNVTAKDQISQVAKYSNDRNTTSSLENHEITINEDSSIKKNQNVHSTRTNNQQLTIRPEGVYIPPRRNSGGRQSKTFIIDASQQIEFGIRKGTWARVSIDRRISSADIGEVEIRLLETIRGKYRDLPANTIFFANKTYNSGTKKMSIAISNALLPDSEKSLSIAAYGYDINKEAGLSGHIIRNHSDEINTAINEGALATIGGVVNKIPVIGNNPISDGIDATTNSLLAQEKKYTPHTPKAVIEVPKQEFFIQIAQNL